MARLQDFQTVTPTSSDKLLVVQSQGQGLVPYGSKLDSANPTGTGSLSLNRVGNTGQYSTAECYQPTASGAYSHAEGAICEASGISSHAEGHTNTASGDYGSHAEGQSTIAKGNTSHCEGYGTRASRLNQHVFGRYNIEETGAKDTRGTYVEIVGNGTADNARSNARTLDWSGNEVLAGGLKINGSNDVIASVYSHADWANSHTFKVAKPATYLLFTDSTNDMAKLKIFPDNVATLYQMIGTTIQSVSLNTSTMEVTVTVNNKGLCAIRLM